MIAATVAAADKQDPPAQNGKRREQNGRRVPIHNQDIDKVDSHPELIVFEPRKQRRRGEEFKRYECAATLG
jgi:hypothetical protein